MGIPIGPHRETLGGGGDTQRVNNTYNSVADHEVNVNHTIPIETLFSQWGSRSEFASATAS